MQHYLSIIIYNSILHTSESYGNLVPWRSREQTMRVRRTLTPDQKGTKKLLRQYDSQLVCAHYRDDAERRLRFITVAADHRTSPLVADAHENGWCDPGRRPYGCERGGATTGQTSRRSVAPQPVSGSCRIAGRSHSDSKTGLTGGEFLIVDTLNSPFALQRVHKLNFRRVL